MSKSSLGIWVDGARPRTLPAAIAPVLVATVLAGGSFNPLTALLCRQYCPSAWWSGRRYP